MLTDLGSGLVVPGPAGIVRGHLDLRDAAAGAADGGLHALGDPLLERLRRRAIHHRFLAEWDTGNRPHTHPVLNPAGRQPTGHKTHNVALKIRIPANRTAGALLAFPQGLLANPERLGP